ncbi:hypothetical protein, partial [uncultured Sunxiuqinia sp.]|uniref:hypothetical protein n=1 Tax=uncultured Sunxiuqinia sp. TaxID=1573825 RepID=UPI0030DDD87C
KSSNQICPVPTSKEPKAIFEALTGGKENSKPIKFRMVYQDTKGNPHVRGNKKGKRHLLDRCFYDFYDFEWIRE